MGYFLLICFCDTFLASWCPLGFPLLLPPAPVSLKVTSAIRAPSNWTPMNLYDCECKLMEVRKYSHEYYDVESKFRHRKVKYRALIL